MGHHHGISEEYWEYADYCYDEQRINCALRKEVIHMSETKLDRDVVFDALQDHLSESTASVPKYARYNGSAEDKHIILELRIAETFGELFAVMRTYAYDPYAVLIALFKRFLDEVRPDEFDLCASDADDDDDVYVCRTPGL